MARLFMHCRIAVPVAGAGVVVAGLRLRVMRLPCSAMAACPRPLNRQHVA